MKTTDIEAILGNTLNISELTLTNDNNRLKLSLAILREDSVLKIEFHNVHSLKIEGVSWPFEIDGIAITDHHKDGWEKHSRYHVYDFEDGKVSFFCEGFNAIDE